MAMTVAQLLQGLVEHVAHGAVCVSGISLSSQTIQPGYAFVALGRGHDFIPEAVSKEASVILCEQAPSESLTTPVIVLENLSTHCGELAARFYQIANSDCHIIGVTGTNGKTSITHLIAQLGTNAGDKVGVIGTTGNGIYPTLAAATHTTPDVFTTHAMIADFIAQGAKVIAMEVSSHGLEQGRVKSVPFKTVLFTNLTRDHLDYHKTIDAYGQAKRLLFLFPTIKQAIINVDCAFGRELADEFASHYTVYPVSESQGKNYTTLLDYTPSKQGTSVVVQTPWYKGNFTTTLLGRFNVMNVLQAYLAYAMVDDTHKPTLCALEALTPIKGRMQICQDDAGPSVVIDYAHTPDALEKALRTTREYVKGQLVCVFGCGGDRDKGKRSEMMQVASSVADKVIVTSDNPRTEEPVAIINDIIAGVAATESVFTEPDRRVAIRSAIAEAKPEDWVVIAGKGHEDYQEIKGVRHHFSDEEVARDCLQELG